MPDNDAPGEAYAEAVRASLDAEHIEYKTVSLAGTRAKDVSEVPVATRLKNWFSSSIAIG